MASPFQVQVPQDAPMMCGPVLRAVGRSMLRFGGWKLVGNFPTDKKVLLIAAPHTSNWDWIIGIGALLALGIQLTYMAKHSLFKGPTGWLMRSTGAVPINRDSARNTVDEIVDQFEQRDQLYYLIAPEGTRKKVERWKSGFLRVAYKAKVPVLRVSFDYATKTISLGTYAELTGDIDKDLEAVQNYYSQFQGKSYS